MSRVLTSKGGRNVQDTASPLLVYCSSTVGDLQGASLIETRLLITSEPQLDNTLFWSDSDVHVCASTDQGFYKDSYSHLN